jgi:hypothetical protein
MSCRLRHYENDNLPNFRPLPVVRRWFNIELSQSEHGSVWYDGVDAHLVLRHCTVDDENAQAMKDQDGDSWATWLKMLEECGSNSVGHERRYPNSFHSAAGTKSRFIKRLQFRNPHKTSVTRTKRPDVRRRYHRSSLYAWLSNSRGLLSVSLRLKSR